MSGSNDVVSEYEVDDISKDDTGNDQMGDADTIICIVTLQSSSDWWNRSLTIPG